MENCKSEVVRSMIITTAGIAGIGTAIDFSTLYVSGAVYSFNEITVFNDADDVVKVQWMNSDTGELEDFMVPDGGKSFTRIMNRGVIVNGSLKVYSLSDSTPVGGNIVINLGKH